MSEPRNACYWPAFAEAFSIARSRPFVSRLPVLVLRLAIPPHFDNRRPLAYTPLLPYSTTNSLIVLAAYSFTDSQQAAGVDSGRRLVCHGTFKIFARSSMRVRHSKRYPGLDVCLINDLRHQYVSFILTLRPTVLSLYVKRRRSRTTPRPR